ncbi:MAG: hypothetical protein AAB969_01600 [Patescibacteria group bacterium]
MALSDLQKYILNKGLEGSKNTVGKTVLKRFYITQKSQPKEEDQINIITKSVDKLIKRGLVKGVGTKTAKKWFVKEVILTKKGVKIAKELLGKQEELPFKNKKKI